MDRDTFAFLWSTQMVLFRDHIRTISSKIFVAVHLWGVDLREVSAGGGEVTAGGSRDLPVVGAVG